MSKKILSLILCLSLLMSLFTLSVSAAGSEADNDIDFSELGKVEDVTLDYILVSKVPDKVDYYEGTDVLDVTGGKVKLVYSDESEEEIDMTANMIAGFDNAVVGEQVLTVTYEGLTATFTVNIVAKKVVNLSVKTPPVKQTYIQGQGELDLTGTTIYVEYNNGTSVILPITDESFRVDASAFNINELGMQVIKVHYDNCYTGVGIDVIAKAVTGIAITAPATKLNYVEGDKLDTTGLKVTASYNDGTDADVTGWTATADLSKAGTKTVTVTYGDFTATYTVKVAHDYAEATCGKPATCKKCGETTGSATGKHDYKAATCTAPKTCKVCGATSGKALGHDYKAATCTAPKTCKVCKATSGKALGHNYETVTKKATLTKNGSIVKKCACGKVESTTTIKYAKTIKLSATSYTYDGKAKKPSVTVKDSAGKTISTKYYTVTYASGRKNVGTYKATVKFKGNYSGSKTLTFKINPAKTTVKKLTAAKKSFKVAITKKSTQVTGYEVQYSTSKKFTSAKTKTIKSYKTTSLTVKSLSAKKTYYVRVRTYKTVNGKKYYSGWSTAKSVKTK